VLLGALLLVLVTVCVLYGLHTCSTPRVVIDIETPDTHLSPSLTVLEQFDHDLLFFNPTTNRDTLVEQLEKLTFLNYGLTSYNYEYVWDPINCVYLESQNVSGPYIGWVAKGETNYLYRAIDGKLIDPPSGMRSSMPLGGG